MSKLYSYSLSVLALVPFISPSISLAATNSAVGSKPNVIFIFVDDMGWGDIDINWLYAKEFNNRDRSNSLLTPNINQMAQEGKLLLRHYNACPISAPSRGSIMCGVTQGHVRQNRDILFDSPIENTPTLASVMKTAGYKTAGFGKWGISGYGINASTGYPTNGATAGSDGVARPRQRGFDYFFGLMRHNAGHCHYPVNRGWILWENETNITNTIQGKPYSTDMFTARAKKWIVDHHTSNPEQPFFIYLAQIAPHSSLRVPTRAYPAGGGINGGLQWDTEKNTVNTAFNEDGTEIAPDTFIHPDIANSALLKTTGGDSYSDDQVRMARRYYTMIRRLDDSVGDLIQLLKDLNIDDNTMIVFTSDNGPASSNTGNDTGLNSFYSETLVGYDLSVFKSYGMMDGTKGDFYEGGVRAPAIIRWPSKIKGSAGLAGTLSTSVEPSIATDWLATLADVAGVEIPSISDGVSLLPTLTGEGEQMPSTIYSELHLSESSSHGNTGYLVDYLDGHIGVTRGQQVWLMLDAYKGIARGLSSFSFGKVSFEIYDTLNDPQESKNLAGTSEYFIGLQERMRQAVLWRRRSIEGLQPGNKIGITYSHINQKSYFDSENVPASVVDNGLVAGKLSFKTFSQSSNFPWVPDFRKTHLIPTSVGAFKVSSGSGLPAGLGLDTGAKGVLLEGYLDVPEDDVYTIFAQTDGTTGSKAFIHLHDMQLVDADTEYTAGDLRSSHLHYGTTAARDGSDNYKRLRLAKGKHSIRIEYIGSVENISPSLTLKWAKGDCASIAEAETKAELIPASAFFMASDLSVNTSEIKTFSPSYKNELDINVGTSGLTWSAQVTSGESWIHIVENKITGKLEVTLDRNTTGANRTGSISVTGSDDSIINIPIEQTGAYSYENWSSEKFSANEGTNNDKKMLVSFSKDGISNFMKYALGLDPTKKYGTPGVFGIDDAGVAFLQYPYNIDATSVEFIAERWNPITQAWTTDNATIEKDENTGVLTVKSSVLASEPITAISRQFLRLRVRFK